MPRVLRCDEGDYNAVTGECAAPYWGEDTGILPPLDPSEAYLIAIQIGGLWAAAWVIKTIRKSLEVKIGV